MQRGSSKNIYIQDEHLVKLQNMARAQNRSVSYIIGKIVESYLANLLKKGVNENG